MTCPEAGCLPECRRCGRAQADSGYERLPLFLHAWHKVARQEPKLVQRCLSFRPLDHHQVAKERRR